MKRWHTPVSKAVQEWCGEVVCQMLPSPHLPKTPQPVPVLYKISNGSALSDLGFEFKSLHPWYFYPNIT